MKKLSLLITLSVLLTARVWAAEDSGFRPLFNGKDLTGWHVRNTQVHNSWSVENGVLKNVSSKDVHGTDLITDEKFMNFTVKFDFMVPDHSNSGFYLRGRHEIQILGDYERGTNSISGNGSLYNFKAPDKFALKPGNEWQSCEATIVGNKITVVLNRIKIHDNVECRKATGGELDNHVDEPGPIMLQGDHGTVSFRNLRIKVLK
ncbi:MAG TPA: DUF1080 domain-containing protein [Candidatus Dormibacteraeota bacterium]|nr:DUF1080 domain-containing protein [Candidatus Dormibacteraeota bacterium]